MPSLKTSPWMWRMSLRKAFAPLVCALGLLAAGCGGGESADPATSTTGTGSPGAETPAGVYRLVSTITKSTIPTNKAGPGSRVELDVFWSCADDDCAVLFQRGATTGLQAMTVRLEPDDDGYAGAHARKGACPGGGSFTETLTWRWTRGENRAVDGTILQQFEGCKLDGTTDYAVTATPTPGARLPYLDEEQPAELAAAITAYDDSVATVYEHYPKCQALGDGTPPSTSCFEAMYRGWVPAVRTLTTAIQAPAAQAQGACRKALDGLDLSGLGTSLASTAAGYTTDKGNNAVKKATSEHGVLTVVAMACVPAEDYASLGDDGRLAIDVDSRVPPGDD